MLLCSAEKMGALQQPLPARAETSALTRISRCGRKPRPDSRRFSMPVQTFDHSLMSIPPAVLAAQLTLLDLPLFQAIPRKELLACQWNCKLKQNVSPHIVAFIAHFNQVCYWLVREILSAQELKARSERVIYIIHLAEAMYELNNINGLKAAMSALSSQPVFRLSLTWDMVGKKEHSTYARLSNLLSEDNNKAALRSFMDTTGRPCVPFLGMYLTDLLFLNTARQGQSGGTSSNRERMESMVDEISVMQCSAYDDLEANLPVRSFIQSHRYLDEMQMFEEDHHYCMSLSLEPKLVQQQAFTSNQSTSSSLDSDGPASAKISRSSTVMSSKPRDTGVLLSRSVSLEQPTMFNHHRRSRSNGEPVDKHDFLFSLSVISPEVSAGPRHLIDGSLMSSSLSVSSASTVACSSGSDSISITDLNQDDMQVVGVAVRCSESDDDSETLLQNGLGDSDDMNNSFDSLGRDGDLISCWGHPVISGVVQIRKGSAKQRDLSESPKFRPLHARSPGSSLIRNWRSATARVCGDQLVFFPSPGTKNGKRRSLQALGDPFSVIDLDADVTLFIEKTRVFGISRPFERSIQVKVQSDSEREDWTSIIRGIITKPTVVVHEPAPPLIDFDEPLCMP